MNQYHIEKNLIYQLMNFYLKEYLTLATYDED